MLQENLTGDEALDALKIGHKQASDELTRLLGLNMQKKVDDLKFYCKKYLSGELGNLNSIQVHLINDFLDTDFELDEVSQEKFERIEKLMDEIERILIQHKKGKVGNKLRLSGIETYTEDIKKFKAENKNVKFLDMNDNDLGIWLEKWFLEVMKSLPSGLVYLELGRNSLGFMEPTDFKKLLNSLPVSIKALSLADNDFHQCTQEELIDMFSVLPKGLKFLRLGGNNLDKYKNADLELPESLDVSFQFAPSD